MSSNDEGSSGIMKELESFNDRLQTLFTDLGVSKEDREAREKKVYAVIAEALNKHIKEVEQEKEDLRQKCVEKQSEIKKMVDLIGDWNIGGNQRQLVEKDLNGPYLHAQKDLESVQKQVEKVYNERCEKADKLFKEFQEIEEQVDGIEITEGLEIPKEKEYSNLSNDYLRQLGTEIQRWRYELQSRITNATVIATNIVSLWAELGTDQESIDSNIMDNYKSDPAKLGAKLNDLERMETIHKDLVAEKERRVNRINELSKNIDVLWTKLSEDEEYIMNFQNINRGLSLDVVNEFEKENNRLQQKKREHINVFIQDARETLRELWKKLYFSKEETYLFSPAWADVYTDASLEAHETEIVKLERLVKEREPIIQLIDAFEDLLEEERQLQSSQQDASRLLTRGAGAKRDPTRLLREEKIRKRISKRKPIVLKELKDVLDEWERDVGEPFLINGQTFNDLYDSELIKTGLKRNKLYTPPSPKKTPTTPTLSSPRTLSMVSSGTNVPLSPTKSPSKSQSLNFSSRARSQSIGIASSPSRASIRPQSALLSSPSRFQPPSSPGKSPSRPQSRLQSSASRSLSPVKRFDPSFRSNTFSSPPDRSPETFSRISSTRSSFTSDGPLPRATSFLHGNSRQLLDERSIHEDVLSSKPPRRMHGRSTSELTGIFPLYGQDTQPTLPPPRDSSPTKLRTNLNRLNSALPVSAGRSYTSLGSYDDQEVSQKTRPMTSFGSRSPERQEVEDVGPVYRRGKRVSEFNWEKDAF